MSTILTLPIPNNFRGDQFVKEVFDEIGKDITNLYSFIAPSSVEIHLELTEDDILVVQNLLNTHTPDPNFGTNVDDLADQPILSQIGIDIRALRNKARDVYAGTATFTAAQQQKILAGLVLELIRRSKT